MTDRILTRRQILGTTSVAFFTGISGCGSILENINATSPESESSTDSQPQATPEPPAVSEPTTSETTVESQSADSSESSSENDASASPSEGGASEPTPGESWTPPEPPHKPIENKRDGRINDVDFINKKEASGGGYSNFNLQVGANTWMKKVDPEPEEDGDPYFAVEINGTLITRTDIVPFRKRGSFKVPIKQAGLQQFNAGTLEVRILLLDIDKQTDDLYGEWTGTIKYRPA